MKSWTFLLDDQTELTVWEHAISCIHWRHESKPLKVTPDQCRIVLTNGQMIDLLRANTVLLYDDIVHPQK